MSVIHTTNSENVEASVRTHIRMPKVVIKQLDQLVGSRERSKFVVEAVIDRISRIKLKQVAHKVAGSLHDVPIPEWETEKGTSAWIHELRREADERLKHFG